MIIQFLEARTNNDMPTRSCDSWPGIVSYGAMPLFSGSWNSSLFSKKARFATEVEEMT